MSRAQQLAVLVTAIGLFVCCQNGGGVTGGSDGGAGSAGSTGGVHSTGVTTPASHLPSEPAACAPRPAVNCPQQTTLPGCKLDSECTAGINGRCQTVYASGSATCACVYDDCVTDADCAAGTACYCMPTTGGAGFMGAATECLTSNCRTDADCASGFCSPSIYPGGPGGCGGKVFGNDCHTSSDECGNDSDCVLDNGGSLGAACVYAPELGHWACKAFSVCAG